MSIIIAGKQPRSQVLVCTDGLANTGCGSLEGRKQDYRAFYAECAERAKVQGVVCSLVSIVGSEANLEMLSEVTEQTGGDVERVNALDLQKNLGALLAKPILAFGAMAMVCLHRGLQFQGEFEEEGENRNWVVKDLGNVTADTEVTFQYAFRPKTEYDLTGLAEIPFQVQLSYRRPDGMHCLRVATATVRVTADRQEAERNADVSVIGSFLI